jgi:HAD superfamily hydrolase (TIGR01509 family)
MRLGAVYSAFDGCELLEKSILQIRKSVDFVIVLYQSHSWYGRQANPVDIEIIQKLHECGLVDYIELFEIDKFATTPEHAQSIERAKRSYGRELCRDNGCDYYLDMDVDEFFDSKQFEDAKQKIINNRLDYTVCCYYNYYGSPTLREQCIYSSMFIRRTDELSNGVGTGLFKECDPTRGCNAPNTAKVYKFAESELIMHNMTGFRRNLLSKYQSTSRGNLERDLIVHFVSDVHKVEKTRALDMSPFLYRRKHISYLKQVPDKFGLIGLFDMERPKTEINKIKLVLFDLDGVLIDMCDCHYRALNMALRDYGYKQIPVTEHLRRFNGRPTANKLEMLRKQGRVGSKKMELVAQRKKEYTFEMISRFEVDNTKVDLMIRLKKDGYKIGVVSNAIRNSVRDMLTTIGVVDLIDCYFGNEDYGNSPKPDPTCYVVAMEQFKVFESETLIVEDSPVGIRAAVDSGAHVKQVDCAKDVTTDSVIGFIKNLEAGK